METAVAMQEMGGEFAEIILSQIDLNSYNARKFDNMTASRQAKFDELVASVREKGILQPIAVRPIATDAGEIRYEVMAGERRYRAAKQVAAEKGNPEATIPAMVYEASDEDAFDIMTVENLQREDLSPVECAESFKAILEKSGNSLDAIKDLSKRFGIAPHAIRLQVALLDLPKAVLDAWNEGKITTAHAEQMTRLSEEKAILAALTECLRQRMTVRELTDHIQAQKPPMKSAKFDQSECAHCVGNSALQRSLFGENNDNGVCLQPACFKAKQSQFFEDNWTTSKAKEMLGTNTFRFKEDLTAAEFIPVTASEPEKRCLDCPEFASVVTVTGGVVKGQEKVCLGQRTCFDDLYNKPKEEPAPVEQEAVPTEQEGEGEASDLSTPVAKPSGAKEAQPAKSSSQDDEKKSERRAEKFREEFYKTALPEKAASLSPNTPMAVRLYLVAMILGCSQARDVFAKKVGGTHYNSEKEKLSAKVFELADGDLLPTLLEMSIAPIMDSQNWNGVSSPQIRDMVAHHIGIDLKGDFAMNSDYFNALSKPELVKIGEEAGVNLWDDEKVKSYKDEHFPKKALMSLKKSELVDLIEKSGIDLKGKTPEEILKTGRAV